MFVAVVGLACAGKSAVVEYLESRHGFQRVCLGDTGAGMSFKTPAEMLHYVTCHWQQHFVTRDIDTSALVDVFEKRPFFLLLGVEAPLLQRWHRAQARAVAAGQVPLSLETFVALDDAVLYGQGANDPPSVDISSLSLMDPQGAAVSTSLPDASTSLLALLQRCQVRIANTFRDVEALHMHLDSLALPSTHRVRPSWDTYFVRLCTLAAMRSNCMKRRVGAVIVRDHRVLSTGYNGTPRGLTNCNEGGCTRCNGSAPCGSSLDECLCLHAEENALLELGRDRGGAQGTILYCNTCPCLRCAVKIVQTGVKEVVYQLAYSMDGRSAQIFAEAGVAFRQYVLPF
ncbi:dCMP deaminase [Malassezia nana]|uniref:Deoxycytidylate deaminase n=1 Tax=Malassezia nana TaxID=180528 RepID=A0AAF0ERB1_9BASI|nr:dCMP deaminase [Malassezia nana]